MRIAVAKKMGPRVVSFEELQAVLLPHVASYKWGRETIRDLWLLGAPVPQQSLQATEKRVLLPGQFSKWWANVRAKMGLGLTAEQLHSRIP